MGRYEKNEKQRQLVVGTELIIRRPNQFYFGLMMVLMTFENLFALKLFLRKVDATVGSIAIAQQKNPKITPDVNKIDIKISISTH